METSHSNAATYACKLVGTLKATAEVDDETAFSLHIVGMTAPAFAPDIYYDYGAAATFTQAFTPCTSIPDPVPGLAAITFTYSLELTDTLGGTTIATPVPSFITLDGSGNVQVLVTDESLVTQAIYYLYLRATIDGVTPDVSRTTPFFAEFFKITPPVVPPKEYSIGTPQLRVLFNAFGITPGGGTITLTYSLQDTSGGTSIPAWLGIDSSTREIILGLETDVNLAGTYTYRILATADLPAIGTGYVDFNIDLVSIAAAIQPDIVQLIGGQPQTQPIVAFNNLPASTPYLITYSMTCPAPFATAFTVLTDTDLLLDGSSLAAGDEGYHTGCSLEGTLQAAVPVQVATPLNVAVVLLVGNVPADMSAVQGQAAVPQTIV